LIDNPSCSHKFHREYDLVCIGQVDRRRAAFRTASSRPPPSGDLNTAKDNAIPITIWYSGTHQIWRDVGVVRRNDVLLRR
jgi:homoserine O-acetyltransferase